MVGRKRRGFTILELMAVISMLGILAAVAIPAYMGYLRRSKASEVSLHLNGMFKAVLNYYSKDLSGKGVTAVAAGDCILDDGAPSPPDPSVTKQPFVADEQFRALGFLIPEPVYYSYGFHSVRGALAADCGAVTANTPSVYTLYSHGDLDGDNILSTYEMTVATNASNQLFHSPGFYIELADE
jgi:type IV pilus assembly protein PilA